MSLFIYQARKNNAEYVSGEINAVNVDEAVELLSQQGLLPISIQEQKKGQTKYHYQKHISQKDIYLFTRQLASLLKSGVALLEALDVLSKQVKSSYLRRILVEITDDIRQGKSFSFCLKERSNVFSLLFSSMVKAGEESGRLVPLLNRMVLYYKQQEEIFSKIRTALIYPIFMLVVGIGTVIFVLTFVLPKIAVLFEGIGNSLPMPTQIVLYMSSVLKSYWWILFLVCVGLSVVWKWAVKKTFFRQRVHQYLLMMPMIKNILIKIELERFTRTLSLLLESGITILRAFEIAIPTLLNETLQKDLWICQTKVAGGVGLGESLDSIEWMPDMVGQLVSIAETSGNLPQALNDIADSYEQDISDLLKIATTLLEPLLILLVGGVIGFIVFAMLLPVFQMDLFAR